MSFDEQPATGVLFGLAYDPRRTTNDVSIRHRRPTHWFLANDQRPTTINMNIGLFGGTFDPIHKGHLALAHAARERCQLGRVYFVPTNVPPHKTAQPGASYFHRYAMTALATQGEKSFVPSLREAPGEFILHDKNSARGSVASAPNYSIDTIRTLKQ